MCPAQALPVRSDETSRRSPPPRDGLTNATRVMTEAQLTKRHRLMVEYMVYGLSHESLRERLPPRYMPDGTNADGAPIQKFDRPPLHEPLSLEDAAAACNVRLRLARQLAKQPVFRRLVNAETEAFRESAKPRAWRRIDALVHDPGAGSAADRKVQLAAAQVMTGEHGDTHTTINMPGSHVKVEAGVVIRIDRDKLNARAQQTLPPTIIEHRDEP